MKYQSLHKSVKH